MSVPEDKQLAGDDSLYGGEGNDWLFGGYGNDKLFGGSGTDMIFGVKEMILSTLVAYQSRRSMVEMEMTITLIGLQ